MKYLVTGGSGFLGQYIVMTLRQQGHIVFAPRKAFFDLRRADDAKRMFDSWPGVDCVIHCAAVVGGIGFNQGNPGSLFHDNALMGIHTLEAARQAGVSKFVGIGTVCSYPKFAPVPFAEESIWDGYPEETNAPYGLAKKMLLVQAQAYRAQYGYNAIHVIPTNLYGPGDNFGDGAHVIPDMIRKIADAQQNGSRTVELYGDGTPTRDFLHVRDAANGIIAAAQHYSDAEPVNLGGDMEISMSDLARVLASLMRYAGGIVWNATRPNGQPRRRVDGTRAQERMGWYPQISFVEGLRETVQWYLMRERALA